MRAARSLVAGDGYPGSLRPPGSPLFVASALAAGRGSLRVARVAQIAVALAGIVALFALVRWRFGTRAAVRSSLLCALHGAVSEATRIRGDVPLLAELLRAQGYRTTAFVNAPLVGRDYGFARGFESFDQRCEERRRDLAELARRRGRSGPHARPAHRIARRHAVAARCPGRRPQAAARRCEGHERALRSRVRAAEPRSRRDGREPRTGARAASRAAAGLRAPAPDPKTVESLKALG